MTDAPDNEPLERAIKYVRHAFPTYMKRLDYEYFTYVYPEGDGVEIIRVKVGQDLEFWVGDRKISVEIRDVTEVVE